MDYVLTHHGILGMKWGKRNGPPYPLDESDKSVREKRLDKNEGGGYNKDKKTDGFHLSDKQKRALKIGAATAATALAAYGAYRLYKSGNLDRLAGIGKNRTGSLMEKKVGEIGDVTFGKQKVKLLLGEAAKTGNTINGIKRLAKPESLADTLKNTNPLRGTAKGRNNCVACGIAGFMRQAGYDVTARSTDGQMQNMAGVVEKCFKGAKVVEGSATKFGKSKKDAAELLVKRFGQNAEGICTIKWNGKEAGHCFNFKIKNGLVSFFDGQGGRNDSDVSRYFNGLIDVNGYMQLARLDNLEIDWNEIKKYIN